MKQYIDKDALLAKIERRLGALANTSAGDNREFAAIIGAQYYELKSLVQYINTLEVKEVDLEKELDYDDYMTFFKEHPEYNNGDWGFEETWVFAQYCYKLGLKAQIGE